jgi:hypothetical protein
MRANHRTTLAISGALGIAGLLPVRSAWTQPVPSAGQAATQTAQEHESQDRPTQPSNPLAQPAATDSAHPVSTPAATQVPPAGSAVRPPAALPPSTSGREWELQAIEVPGEARPLFREEDRVGDYGQPRWTAIRRFPTTRIYVIPAGKAEFEWWLRYTFPVKDAAAGRDLRTYYEMSFGLGHRLQLDLYLVTQQSGHGGDESKIELKREQVELRYALADWGRIWGNPTLYLEWQHRNGEHDWIEPKLLLGGQLAPGWHGGLNLVWEKELGGPNWETEYNAAVGISRTVVDETLHIGAEGYVEAHDIAGQRFKFSDQERMWAAGPSFLLQPVRPMHILFTPLIGRGAAAGENMRTVMRLWFVSGWTF